MGERVKWENGFWKKPLAGDETEPGKKEEATETSEDMAESVEIPETTQEVKEAQGKSEEGSVSWLWFAAAGTLIIIVILLLYVVLRRKRKKEKEKRCQDKKAGETTFGTGGNIGTGYFYDVGRQTENVSIVLAGNIHHIGNREEQQDSFTISDFTNPVISREKGCLAVVADGMGGLSEGGKISAMITATMLHRFEKGGCPGDRGIPMELLQSVQEANEKVLQLLKGDTGKSGSTVVAAWIYGSRLHYISVGDSQICLIRRNTLTVLNREHTYGSELDEKAARGEISLQAAQSDPQRQALTSYIGVYPLKKVDRSFHGIPLLPGDKILLMSDGVFGTLPETEILAEAGQDAIAMAEGLQQRILFHGKLEQDNFTAVVLQCE
ncbi:MAG: serine/threonine-protein phosphatase [Lachnospiraceae bacterium]|nr:serine/threonine-protein phosphatase [Lachnospiraceae bacterium]